MFRKVQIAVALVSAFGCMASAHAEAWSFGVISDTQWLSPSDPGQKTVATGVIGLINQQFVKSNVDLVVQVGDLTDTGSQTSLQTRFNANADLAAAGIDFYALRGNHESSAANATQFKNIYNYTGSGYSSPTADQSGLTYSFTHNNTKFVMLDQFTTANGTAYNVGNQQSWITSELSAADHQQAFVFSHKNLLGQNHKDNLFGSDNDSNPIMQNDFIGSLANNNVKYEISGHDHMNYRSVVTSPDGKSQVQEIIGASDSNKFYTPSTPVSSRDNPLSQELNTVGYYVYSVDGARVTGKYYAAAISDVYTTVGGVSTYNATPDWQLKDTFGYSLNGQEKIVFEGQNFSISDDTTKAETSENGYLHTFATLTGMNGNVNKDYNGRGVSKAIDTGWSKAEDGLASDVLSVWGTDSLGQSKVDPYSLTLSFKGTGGKLVHRNFGDTTWTDVAGYTLNADSTITASVTGMGEFAVAAVPEPESYAMLLAGLGLLGFVARRRNKA